MSSREQLLEVLTNKKLDAKFLAIASQFDSTDFIFIPPFERFFREEILNQLDEPRIVTYDDLVQALSRISLEPLDWHRVLNVFKRRVLKKLGSACLPSRPLPVSISLYRFEKPPKGEILWSRGDQSVQCCGTGPAGAEVVSRRFYPRDSSEVIYFEGYGPFSKSAQRDFEGSLANISRSLIASFLYERPLECKLPRLDEDEHTIRQCFEFLSHAYSIVFTRAKKGTLEQSLRNAILLLAEADQQSSSAICLSLCCSAMEAMLCDGSNEIARTLSENVAVLLEPDRLKRSSATKVVKQLYNIRSLTLHGSKVQHDKEHADRARFLSSAVLHAILQRQVFLHRCEGPQDRRDLLNEINESRFDGKIIPGVEESPARSLWQ